MYIAICLTAIVYSIQLAGQLYIQRTAEMRDQVLSKLLMSSAPTNEYWVATEKPDDFWWTWRDGSIVGRFHHYEHGIISDIFSLC